MKLMSMPRAAVLTAAVTAAFIAAPAAASAATCNPPAKRGEVAHVNYSGMKSQLFCFGPITIKPGQNTIEFPVSKLVPNEEGYITRFDPDLVYTDTNEVPGVDVLHLHHGVWAVNNNFSNPQWAAGEEKTIFQLPRGFGWRSHPTDTIIVNHMIHNLYPVTAHVYLTWRVDFVPLTSPDAASIKRAQTLWLDVAGLKAYPVFDVLRGSGSSGKYTFPDQARGAERRNIGSRHEFTATRDMTLIGTAGHEHPGGLKTELRIKRAGRSDRKLFESLAQYFEPAGAVSWDVAMTATKPSWRVKVKPGDKLAVNATYDTKNASWYESMGIMPIAVYYGSDAGGDDPFVTQPPITGEVTHGHLNENDNHGGKIVTLNDATKLISGSSFSSKTLPIKNYVYTQGDLSLGGLPAGRPPTVRRGSSITFRNDDSTGNPNTDYVFHTITACKNPCNKDTGIAYPLANGAVQFDSGQLGYGPGYATPTANRKTWSTPKNLPTGTYSYFCRVHPYMRGALRVTN